MTAFQWDGVVLAKGRYCVNFGYAVMVCILKEATRSWGQEKAEARSRWILQDKLRHMGYNQISHRVGWLSVCFYFFFLPPWGTMCPIFFSIRAFNILQWQTYLWSHGLWREEKLYIGAHQKAYILIRALDWKLLCHIS